MASQGPNSTLNASQAPGQAQESVAQLQMRRDEAVNQPSDVRNQGSLLEETGTQVKNMAQGAAQGAVNLARGAASGAANIAYGAADAVKNTLGINSAADANNNNNNNNASYPAYSGGTAGVTNPTSTDHPSNPITRI